MLMSVRWASWETGARTVFAIIVVCIAAAVLFLIAWLNRTRRSGIMGATDPVISQARDPQPASIEDPPTRPLPPKARTPPGGRFALVQDFATPPQSGPRKVLSAPGTTVSIDLPKIADTGVFARYVPFGDKREVIVRRGTELGHHYGFEKATRRVRISGTEYEVVTYEGILSPPPLRPGQAPNPEADELYHPTYDVLYLPGVEAMIPRRPKGFVDSEVQKILQSIHVNVAR